MGIPLPGEIVLVSAALLTDSGVGTRSAWQSEPQPGPSSATRSATWSATAAAGPCWSGSAAGSPSTSARTTWPGPKRIFARWGVWAVFFGRFVALLRILAGPLAGALRVPYRKFLVANASGGIIWATGTTFVVYWRRCGGRGVAAAVLLDGPRRRDRVRDR